MLSSAAIRASHAAAGTLVSVYAAMLGFMVALNALAEPAPARGHDAIKGIQSAFGGAAVLALTPVRDPGAALPADAAVRAMAVLAQAFGRPLVAPAAAETYDIRFVSSMLFAPGEPRLRADRAPMLAQAVGFIADDPQWHLELLMEGGTARAKPLTRARAAALAEFILSLGLPPARLSVIADGDGDGDGKWGVRLRAAGAGA